jgi:hypothetical protein
VGGNIDGQKLDSIQMEYKELEIERGFLVHLSISFKMLTHHLKGFHLALVSHSPHWTDDGWKVSDAEWMAYLSLKVENNILSREEADLLALKTKVHEPSDPPERIPLIQHLRDDIFSLREFFDLPIPPEIQARQQMIHMLRYCFADASGGGLGSTINIPGIGIRCRMGVWGKDDESTSSTSCKPSRKKREMGHYMEHKCIYSLTTPQWRELYLKEILPVGNCSTLSFGLGRYKWHAMLRLLFHMLQVPG